MDILTKIKWAVAIVCVFLVILATNLLDQNNFVRVEESVDSIYNERLVAKEALLNLSIKFHEKEIAHALQDSNYFTTKCIAVNENIGESLEQFPRSGATKDEKYLLDELINNHSKLIALENSSQFEDSLYNNQCALIFSDIKSNINDLATEQMNEGKYQKRLATEAVESVNMFSKIEMYALVFLALLLLVIVLYSPRSNQEEEQVSN
ncbi:MAG: hypothetical protein P8P74_12745 [Crocinitomicaceae bacterium]|nr:hypothetical protein [Crocinitomicaceae bacterium]